MALTKHGIKDQKLVSFGGRPNHGEEEKREKKRRRRGRGREEEEKRRGKLSQKGMELCIDLYGTTKLGMDPCFCLVNGLPQT